MRKGNISQVIKCTLLSFVTDYQFPIDVSGVAKDHPFLETDSLQSLFRRLQALNRCANMKLDTHHTHHHHHNTSHHNKSVSIKLLIYTIVCHNSLTSFSTQISATLCTSFHTFYLEFLKEKPQFFYY